MANVDWRLGGEGFDASQSLQAYGQAAQQTLLRQREAAAIQQQQRQLATRQQAGGLVASGDLAGARSAALGAGDFDLATTVNGFEDHHREELQRRAETIGGLAAGLRGKPEAERQAAFAAVAPQLAERGFTPEQLAQVDLSDAGLDGYIGFATQAKDAIGAYNQSRAPYTLTDGAQRYVGGEMIAQNERDAPRPHYIFDSESGSWLLEPGTGGGAQPSLPQPGYTGAAPNATGNFNGLPGERVTSTYRSPSHNAEVGGVPNSYHMRRDAQGNPLARDSVPPAGMSMTQYAAVLRRENPGRDVIMEGDHVHMEPGRRTASSAAPSPNAPTGSVVNVRPPKAKGGGSAPSGYRFNGDRLEPIPGGPADPSTPTNRNVQSDRRAEVQFRQEFDNLPEVKTFKTARQQFQALRNTAGNPNATAQDDIAAIFQFMKTLDPTSTVREGEFATAQNATGVPDGIRNAFNRAQSGHRLNAQQRQQMIATAGRSYLSFRDAYNSTAERYRGYARDSSINPDHVAGTYAPQQPARPPAQGHPANIQTLLHRYGR